VDIKVKVKFLGQHKVKKQMQNPLTTIKHIITTNETYKWEAFHECEMDRELIVGNYININGETKIERVIYELDGSISYKTTRILSQI
jgi:hypothetical protein